MVSENKLRPSRLSSAICIAVELKKQISCLLELSNKTDDYVAFKVMTTNPMKYCVRPNSGVISPRSKDDVIVTMQKQLAMPPDMQCRDRFLVQSVVTSDAASSPAEMFSKESGHAVEEVKLRVVYVSKPRVPSPVPEEVEESPTEPSAQANGSLVTKGLTTEGVETMDSSEVDPVVYNMLHEDPGNPSSSQPALSTASSLSSKPSCRDLSTDLRLGLSISSSSLPNTTCSNASREQISADWPPIKQLLRSTLELEKRSHLHPAAAATFFVKVYMDGIPIGRKLDLFTLNSYEGLTKTLGRMFRTSIV